MTDAEKIIMLEELFDVDAGSLQPDTVLEALEEWDSVNKLSLIILIDDEFNRAIDGNDIKNFQCIQDIMNIMSAV